MCGCEDVGVYVRVLVCECGCVGVCVVYTPPTICWAHLLDLSVLTYVSAIHCCRANHSYQMSHYVPALLV